MLEKFTVIRGKAVPLRGEDIDTDRIIPARFMKALTFEGLGQYLFYDERFDEQGNPKPHPLNDPRYQGASILLVESGFGSGSSREHAPQAIKRAGFKAIIGESFAEIFFGNATAIGLPCVALAPEDLALLFQMVEANPGVEVTIDLVQKEVRFGDKVAPLFLREEAREALVQGLWDPIGELLEAGELLDAFDRKLPYPRRAE
ncbi:MULTISPECIES: 3-isopropylmalate dehydratase small subunit [Thermus]|jgi:3-isopropylmalate/(R)-2-methylmalate dehydratase small subunit|uniref:3-isopropylmalate dehydratase small subunit n=1 Tax=Thermus brockianus TaxID=56956 RepID=A0A1J0LUF4_THEBO|nr:3-isopropylmalate dehydratase small subunit [Thermus brockianus]APD09856.1 isopropylmalate isomerase small subunit [Thermus brockianus]BDG16832.1 3-isopropylmalate dehydratase small subunit [Thermus brockianus]